jgi:hypothetical protein
MTVERKSIPPIHQRKFLIGRALIAPSPKRLRFPDQRLPSLETFPCSSHYFRGDHSRSAEFVFTRRKASAIW